MTHVPHQLAEEFPEHREHIAELRQTDPHFARLAERYADVNSEIHRMETDVTPTDDATQSSRRKARAALKDEIYAALTRVRG
ncbi:YdcH family protein [Litorisediminicola beolgyonensis]|uniref:YdcH family protein n=1 Tax=Litorisediminicola beolgyonensis TaxID=1173614 RepID=A0ABW3ZDQ4_9RHOB